MTTASVKAHLFRVRPIADAMPFKDLLELIEEDDLEKRIRTYSGAEYRLENITSPAGSEKWWQLNFVKLRDGHGPGRASRKKPLEDFDLGADEYFGEDTAVLFDPATNFAIIQYNHSGPRPTAIAHYLTVYREDETHAYALELKLDQDAERRFNEQTIHRSVEVAFDVTKMNAADRVNGEGLAKMAKMTADGNGGRLEIKISVGNATRSESLAAGVVNQIIQFANKILNTNNGTEKVKKLTVYGSAGETGALETIDLLHEKLEFVDTLQVGAGRRIELTARLKFLKRARAQWKSVIEDDGT